ncbi:putative MULE transposase domain-containing protein 2 [Homarus americanus]|uniref:Putative MULE transposase domain-containing protein 2 n=1 Tax=Homarus americanus TaxID=6706 RepID=A0A8J5N6W1_HOMAM|nr:putative MULE transposase domain-containing protein 2 [Homarus americanus]
MMEKVGGRVARIKPDGVTSITSWVSSSLLQCKQRTPQRLSLTQASSQPSPFQNISDLFIDPRPDSEQNLRLLPRSDIWMMDGNFAMDPPKFMQLFVIRVPLGDTAVSVVYAILQRNTQDTYEELLKAVLDKCSVYFLCPDPSTVMLDFEQAIHQAITAVLGTEVTCHGCFYHSTQASWRKIQELGLTTIYKDSEGVKLFCGTVDILAFLPLEDIPAGIDYLRDHTPDGLEPFLTYFDQTYVTGSYRLARQYHDDDQVQAVHLRRIPP